jgi:hypothetical protein
MKSFRSIGQDKGKALKPEEIDVVLYHEGCPDGYGAAYAIWKAFPDKPIQYYALHPKQNPPKDLRGGIVCVDYAPRAVVVLGMIRSGNKVLIIDHHKTNEDALKDIPEENKIFDMTHSACYLTWHFVACTVPPMFLQYIEAYDLYDLKRLAHVDAFHAWFSGVVRKKRGEEKSLFAELDRYNDEDLLNAGIERGKNYMFILNTKMREIADRAFTQLTLIGDQYYIVVYCNCVGVPVAQMATLLLKRFPLADFVAIFQIGNNITNLQLRSEPGRADVSHVALQFGGGGHIHAAGMVLSGCTCCIPGQHFEGDFHKALTSKSRISSSENMLQVDYPRSAEYLLRYLMQGGVALKVYNLLWMDKREKPFEHIVVRSYDAVVDRTNFTSYTPSVGIQVVQVSGNVAMLETLK